jgi:ABC-type Fe3+-hydroxamate transport system substrate-binding protein
MTHRSTPLAALAATLAIALVAAGCGSSSDSNSTSSSTSSAALTKAEFLVKANAICAAGNKVKASVASIQAQIDGVRALGAPSGDESTVKNMLDIAQADLDKVKSNPALLNGGGDTFGDFAALAHPYGLTQCAPDS